MNRRWLIGLLTVLALGGAGDAAAALGSSAPILANPGWPSEQGYGRVEPPVIFNGGDPTGLLRHIEWLTWGGSRAVGVGISTYVGPNKFTAEGMQQPAVVVLFELGSCHGQRAYEAAEWYFPEHGERFRAHSQYKLCKT